MILIVGLLGRTSPTYEKVVEVVVLRYFLAESPIEDEDSKKS